LARHGLKARIRDSSLRLRPSELVTEDIRLWVHNNAAALVRELSPANERPRTVRIVLHYPDGDTARFTMLLTTPERARRACTQKWPGCRVEVHP
jgi:hypothetical protein